MITVKLIYNEIDPNGAPYVSQQAWSGAGFIVTVFLKPSTEMVICQADGPGQTIHSFPNIKVYPLLAYKGCKVTFIYEFLRDVQNLDANILWCTKIEILDIKTCKPGSFA